MKKTKIIILTSTTIFLMATFIIAAKFYNLHRDQKLEFVGQNEFSRFVRPESVRLGRQTAKVYLIEFLDPECESCREFYPMIKTVMREFEGQIQLVIRYIPFHPNSNLVIRIVEAARLQNRYWETLEALFKTQPIWGSHHDPRPEVIWTSLEGLGLDMDRLKIDMDRVEISKIIEQDVADAKVLGIRGTPTFFINGKVVTEFGYPALKERLLKAVLESEDQK